MSVKMPFKAMEYRESAGTEFGKPTFVKFGKEIDIQEYIESNREDTEIYPTLEKYGTLKPLEKSYAELYGDFQEYNDLRTCMDKAIKSREMWDSMPQDFKHEFNNDINEFIDRGMEWASRKIEQEQQAKTEAQTAPAETTGE